MTARIGNSRAPAQLGRDVRLLVGLLAVSAVVELLVLRSFTRSAIHIPALDQLQGPYTAAAFGGRYAYFVSVALLLVLLPAVAWRLWGVIPRPTAVATTMALAAFGAVALLAATAGADRLLLDAVTLGAVAVLAGTAVCLAPRRALLPLCLFALAFLLRGAHGLVQSAALSGLPTFDTSLFLGGGEVMGVAFALALPLVLGRRPDRVAVIGGCTIGAVALLVFLGNGSTSRFLLLWNVGLSGTLPGLAYAAAAGTISVAIVGLAREGRLLSAAAFTLLTAGGIGLHNTYQTGLVLLALSALSLAWAWPAGSDSQ